MSTRQPIQLQFPTMKEYTRTRHGGDCRTGKRKLARPVAVKSPMHLVLRSSKARGQWSMLSRAHCHHIDALVVKHARANHVQVLRLANVGNHLHLLIQPRTRIGFQRFLRSITGLIARLVTGSVKGRPNGAFWDHLAFSRVVKWGKDSRRAAAYVFQNAVESFGMPTSRNPVAKFRGTVFGFS